MSRGADLDATLDSRFDISAMRDRSGQLDQNYQCVCTALNSDEFGEGKETSY